MNYINGLFSTLDKVFTFKFFHISVVFLLGTLLFSCSPLKKVNYLQPEDTDSIPEYYHPEKKDYKIQPGDVLHVRITSLDEQINKMFNTTYGDQLGTGMQQPGFYLTGYSVSDSGMISLPVIGKIYIKDKTIEGAKQLIQKRTKEFVKEAFIDVKFVSFHFTIIGEISSPGHYTVYRDQMTLMDAVGLAGDLTYNSNRKKVHVYRRTPQGITTQIIDLTTSTHLNSEDYYLMPNDIVYVEPLKITVFRKRLGDYAFIFSMFTSVITVVLLLTKLQ